MKIEDSKDAFIQKLLEETEGLKAVLNAESEAKHQAFAKSDRILAGVEQIEKYVMERLTALDHNQRNLFHRVQELERPLQGEGEAKEPKEQWPKEDGPFLFYCRDVGLKEECRKCEIRETRIVAEAPTMKEKLAGMNCGGRGPLPVVIPLRNKVKTYVERTLTNPQGGVVARENFPRD